MNTLRAFLLDFARSFTAPVRLYADIRDGRRSPSWLCVLIYCAAYVGGAIWLHLNGFTPFSQPWITLDPRIYYLTEAVYLTPLIFLIWILGAGTAHVLATLVDGEGSFDITLRMTGYSLWAPWYPLIIVDSIHSTPDWLYNTILAVSVAWLLAGTTIALRLGQRLSWPRAVVVSLAAIIVIAGFTLTFIR
jgi:hypothetical protein